MADRSNRYHSSATLAEMMDGLRMRLVLVLWAGTLVFILAALYDLPTNNDASTANQHHNLRGPLVQSELVMTTTTTMIRTRSWTPFLEEEVRAIDRLAQPLRFLGLLANNNNNDENEEE